MSGAFRAIDPSSAQERDPNRLYWLDLACLRFLLRCGAATATQVAQLVFGNLRLAQYHVLRLYRSGLLERTAVVQKTPRAEYAYRVGPLGHQRLGTRRTPAPATYVRHMLDTVEVVCSLNRSEDREHAPVQLWVPDASSGAILGRFVRPDSIVVITTDAGSTVLALEIDEATEHARTIRAKLAAYRRPIGLRPNWHVVVVVPSLIRANWMVRQAASLDLGPRAWVAIQADITRDSLDTVLRPLATSSSPQTIRSLLRPPVRQHRAPVGSHAWLELLAEGGGEAADGVLAP